MSSAANQPESVPVVLITGADGGLGRALVPAFVMAGWRVVAAHHLATSHDESPSLWPLAMDVTDGSKIKETVAQITERWGTVHALINNAGLIADRLSWELKETEWEEVLRVNLKGAFLCARAVLPGMIRRRDGQIINIASVSGRQGRTGQANYAAAKAGLFGLTMALAKEVGSRNVRVNAVVPGVMATGMVRQLTDQRRQELESAHVLGRICRVEEVARFIVFLTTLQDVSGQVFQLDSRIGRWS